MILPRLKLSARASVACQLCGRESPLISEALELCVAKIASFVASLNPEIPYSLLEFHPQFFMSDLPTTARHVAYTCPEAAKQTGLRKVRIGNLHPLQDY